MIFNFVIISLNEYDENMDIVQNFPKLSLKDKLSNKIEEYFQSSTTLYVKLDKDND